MAILQYKMTKKIPNNVKLSFDYYVKNFNAKISFIGVADGADVYKCDLPGDTESGFPLIVKYKDGHTTPVDCIESAKLAASFFPED